MGSLRLRVLVHELRVVYPVGRVFEIIGTIVDIETIATGREIRELRRLQKAYGRGRWRKLKGIARIRLTHGGIHTAEVHWYEAHGIGRKEFKIKRLLG